VASTLRLPVKVRELVLREFANSGVRTSSFVNSVKRKDTSCHESKISFLSTNDKLKLKNDATYEGIRWYFLRNFCSSPFLNTN